MNDSPYLPCRMTRLAMPLGRPALGVVLRRLAIEREVGSTRYSFVPVQ